MATINLGKIGIVNKGAYAAGTYKYLEVVKNLGVVYICNVASTTEAPPHADWFELVRDGDIIALDAVPTNGSTKPVESNGIFDALTTLSGAITDGDALSVLKTGSTMTGAITSLRETAVDMGIATAIDLATGNMFTKTITGATTFTVSNVPATGQAIGFVLKLTNGGSSTVTWFSGVKWAGGTAPTLTAAGVDTLGFISHDGGTNWYGYKLGLDMK